MPVPYHRHSGGDSGPPVQIGAAIKSVAVTVAATQTSGSSAADPDLVNGVVLGMHPTGNQDQYVDNVALNADGSVTITLAATATANNTFKVIVAKP